MEWQKYALLFSLYFIQGMPTGFDWKLLPLLLVQQKWTLAQTTAANWLRLPWMVKFIWAPFAEAGNPTTLLRTMQAVYCAAWFAAAWLYPDLNAVVWVLLLLNILTSSIDIVVDGLAINVLGDNEEGTINIFQVVSYQCGMVLAGGLFPYFLGTSVESIRLLFVSMGLVVAIASIFSQLLIPRVAAAVPRNQPKSMQNVFQTLLETLTSKEMAAVLVLCFVSKTGEHLVDASFIPQLRYTWGYTDEFLAKWCGIYGMIAAMAGAATGGVLATWRGPLVGVLWASIFRMLPQALHLATALYDGYGNMNFVKFLIIFTNFANLVHTSSLFSFMMSTCNASVGGAHYTFLACAEVSGKSIAAFLSGSVISTLGVSQTCGLAAMLSALSFPVLTHLMAHGKFRTKSKHV